MTKQWRDWDNPEDCYFAFAKALVRGHTFQPEPPKIYGTWKRYKEWLQEEWYRVMTRLGGGRDD
jgi:hypothetical protein